MEEELNTSKAKQLIRSCFAVIGIIIMLGAIVAIVFILRGTIIPLPDSASSLIGFGNQKYEAAQNSISAGHGGIIPAKLIIPSLNIDAAVEKTGITARGTMGTPTSFSTTAWYEYGPEPGQVGMAFIDGHVNNGLGLAGVFVDLDQIKIGDDIFVTDSAGTKLHYVVVSTSTIDYTGTVSDITAFQSKTEPQLVLITCEGTWVPSQKTYDKRIVVLADLK